jgi:uncharacterized protein (TIGR01777 family)
MQTSPEHPARTIGVTGSSGFLANIIGPLAQARGHRLVAFTRRPGAKPAWAAEERRFAAEEPPDLSGLDAVIHLAGESVAGLWTAAKKRRIRESRLATTRRVAEAIARRPDRPCALVCASGVGYYGDRGDDELTEESACGSGFLAEVVAGWESEAGAAAAAGGRVVCLRLGVVLGRGGGMLPLLARAFRLGLGGKLGSGRQWMSWIHATDAARLFLTAAEDPAWSGPVNAVAPAPLTNADFTRLLARAVRRPAWLHMPAFLLRLPPLPSELFLASQRALPRAAQARGFAFGHPEMAAALADLTGLTPSTGAGPGAGCPADPDGPEQTPGPQNR